MVQARVNTRHSRAYIKRNERKVETHQMKNYRDIQAKIDAKNREALEQARKEREKRWQEQQAKAAGKPALQARPSSAVTARRRRPRGEGARRKSLEKLVSYLKPIEDDKPKQKLTLKTLPTFVCDKCRRRWRWCQGYYPARGGPPETLPPPYVPPEASVKDTESKRKLKAAMDVRIIRYPEPFAELLLTSNPLEPKNYKIMVNNQVLYYSYDYTPYMPNISNYIQQFSQIMLDPDNNVALYFECCKFPNELKCCTSCLDCRKCTLQYPDNVCYMRAPNGHLLGRVVRIRPRRLLYSQIGFDIFGNDENRILTIRKQCFLQRSLFTIATGDNTEKTVGTIKRRLVPDSKYQLIPNHYDYKILLEVNQNDAEIKLLLIGACFLIDFMLDTKYRPFIRYGSRVIPTFRGRYSQ